MAEYEKFVPSEFLIEKLLDDEITFPIPPSDIRVTKIVIRFLNLFHLKSPADVYCYLIIINSIYEGGIYQKFPFNLDQWSTEEFQNIFPCTEEQVVL